MYMIVIIGLIIALDQVFKFLIQSNMELGQSIPVIENIFHITYIHNYGAAFSIFQNKTILLIVLPMIIMIGIVVVLVKMGLGKDKFFTAALGLVVAGGIGNLIDRIFYGYVVDFLDFRVFPIFNVADVAVCCGCGLLILYVFFIEPKKNQGDANE